MVGHLLLLMWAAMALVGSCVHAYTLPRHMNSRRVRSQAFGRRETTTRPLSDGSFASNCKEHDRLCNVAASVAGVFDKAFRTPNESLQRTVLVVSCNYGFADMLLNWICHARKLGLLFFVYAMDRKLHNFLQEYTDVPSIFDYDADGRTGDVPSEAVDFLDTKRFGMLTCQKLLNVKRLVELGFDVWFSDVDVAFMQDPFDSLDQGACQKEKE